MNTKPARGAEPRRACLALVLLSATAALALLSWTAPVPRAGAQETPAPTYTNPVSRGAVEEFPDPTIVQAKDGYWYAYSTYQQTPDDFIGIVRSEDLVDWGYADSVFTSSTRPDWHFERGDDRYVKLVSNMTGSRAPGADYDGFHRQTEFAKEVPTSPDGFYGVMFVGPSAETIRLRLRHTVDPADGEHEYRASTSPDGENWVRGGAWTLQLTLVGADEDRNATEGPIFQKLGGEWRVFASNGDDTQPTNLRGRYPIYDLDMAFTGYLGAPHPTNIPHPMIAPLRTDTPTKRTKYIMVTFNGAQFYEDRLGYGTHGDLFVFEASQRVRGFEF